MKYLCLVYHDEAIAHSAPDSPVDSECHAYAEKVGASGKMLAGQALQPAATATTVRVRDGKTITTDGPFAETKEQLAGFYMIEAESPDEALEVAAGIPTARIGSVEVRPIRDLEV